MTASASVDARGGRKVDEANAAGQAAATGLVAQGGSKEDAAKAAGEAAAACGAARGGSKEDATKLVVKLGRILAGNRLPRCAIEEFERQLLEARSRQ